MHACGFGSLISKSAGHWFPHVIACARARSSLLLSRGHRLNRRAAEAGRTDRNRPRARKLRSPRRPFPNLNSQTPTSRQQTRPLSKPSLVEWGARDAPFSVDVVPLISDLLLATEGGSDLLIMVNRPGVGLEGQIPSLSFVPTACAVSSPTLRSHRSGQFEQNRGLRRVSICQLHQLARSGELSLIVVDILACAEVFPV